MREENILAMTFSEYKSFQAPAGFRDEFIHGNCLVTSPDRKHADLCSALYDLLKPRLRPEFVVRQDTTHLMGEKEGPRPDFFVIQSERWIAADETGGYPKGSPELTIDNGCPVLRRLGD